MAWNNKIPINSNGYPMEVVHKYYHPLDESIKWIDNHEWEDTLKFLKFNKYQSSIKAWFSSKKYGIVSMFLSDLEIILKNNITTVNGLYVTGTFTFCKRGAYYGVKLSNEY